MRPVVFRVGVRASFACDTQPRRLYTLLLGRYSSCAAFAAAQLNKVAAEVYKDSVSNVPRWGNDIHQAEFVSELFGTTPLACFADRFTPHGGDESTVRWVTVCMPWQPVADSPRLMHCCAQVNVGHYDKNTFVMEAGPSYRQVSSGWPSNWK